MKPKTIISILNIMTMSAYYVASLVVILIVAMWIYYIATGNYDLKDIPGTLIHNVTSFGKISGNVSETYTADGTLAYLHVQNQFKLKVSPVTPLGYYSIIIFLLFAAIGLSILKGFMNIFQAIKLDRPFTPRIIVLLRRLSLLFIAADFLNLIHFFIFGWFMGHLLPANRFSLNIAFGHFAITGVIISVIGVIYQRGVELQTENDLTV